VRINWPKESVVIRHAYRKGRNLCGPFSLA
jgi:hypothetical protein